jgi:putative hemolysin
LNLFTALHSRIIRPLYFKITLYLFSPALTILYLISTPLLIIFRKILSAKKNDNQKKSTLKDFFSSSLNELKEHVSANDKSLIESICLFDTLEARQIMIPKVDMFCLDQETSVYTAAKACINMGFSRIPVFDGKVDNIHSVLLFKDLLKASLNLTIEEQKKKLIKSYTSPIIFSPETKKIKDLFQEIKKQRIHASIIINEYGCTEGLVTMEDILEELLGSEILDESDIDEQILFIPIKDNSWIVNPKMSIIDARKHLDIDFKDSSEYETITGYIFSKMGAIPKPGAYIQEDSFHINILNSDQRKISKVKITKIMS